MSRIDFKIIHWLGSAAQGGGTGVAGRLWGEVGGDKNKTILGMGLYC